MFSFFLVAQLQTLYTIQQRWFTCSSPFRRVLFISFLSQHLCLYSSPLLRLTFPSLVQRLCTCMGHPRGCSQPTPLMPSCRGDFLIGIPIAHLMQYNTSSSQQSQFQFPTLVSTSKVDPSSNVRWKSHPSKQVTLQMDIPYLGKISLVCYRPSVCQVVPGSSLTLLLFICSLWPSIILVRDVLPHTRHGLMGLGWTPSLCAGHLIGESKRKAERTARFHISARFLHLSSLCLVPLLSQHLPLGLG